MNVMEPGKLLLVDDDPPQLSRHIKRFCEDRCLRYEGVSHPTEAQQMIEAGELPSILLIDHRFDGDDIGLSFLRWVNARRTTETVLVFTSGFLVDLDGLTVKAKEGGADIVLAKGRQIEIEEKLEQAYRLWIARRARQPTDLRGPIEDVRNRFEQASRSLSDLDDRKAGIERPVVIITPFSKEEDRGLSRIIDSLREALSKFGFVGLTVEQPPELAASVPRWVSAHLHYCARVIAIFYRREADPEGYFNPNVALEVGFAMALEKPVLLLNCLGEEYLPANFGMVYEPIDLGSDLNRQVEQKLEKWLRQKTD